MDGGVIRKMKLHLHLLNALLLRVKRELGPRQSLCFSSPTVVGAAELVHPLSEPTTSVVTERFYKGCRPMRTVMFGAILHMIPYGYALMSAAYGNDVRMV